MPYYMVSQTFRKLKNHKNRPLGLEYNIKFLNYSGELGVNNFPQRVITLFVRKNDFSRELSNPWVAIDDRVWGNIAYFCDNRTLL
jgi:hypothetical protein